MKRLKFYVGLEFLIPISLKTVSLCCEVIRCNFFTTLRRGGLRDSYQLCVVDNTVLN